MEEKPLLKPLALTRSWVLVSASIAAGFDQESFSPEKIASKTSLPPIRSKRNSSHIMLVQRDWPASENGAMFLALNLGTRSMMSPQLCGGWAPIFSNACLL